MGYYRPNSWCGTKERIYRKININPKISQLPPKEIFSKLIHEISHYYQYAYGKPGRGGHHNTEFSRIMFSKGLMCLSTGKPGEKTTGRRMSDCIIEGSLFMQAFNELPSEYLLPFKSLEPCECCNRALNCKYKSAEIKQILAVQMLCKRLGQARLQCCLRQLLLGNENKYIRKLYDIKNEIKKFFKH